MNLNKQQDVERQLLANTFNYLAENGMEKFSMRELSKATGVSVGSVYYWFDNKDELLVSVAEYGMANVAEGIATYIYEIVETRDVTFDDFKDALVDYKLAIRFIYQLATSPTYGHILRKMSLALDKTFDRYAHKMADSIGCPHEEIEPLVYLAIAAILDYIIWEDDEKARLQFRYIYATVNKLKGR